MPQPVSPTLSRRLCAVAWPMLLGLLASGCANLSESDCRSGNWDAIGYDDGSQGRQQGRAVDHEKTCSKYGVQIDEQAYFAGYERGLDVYCNEDNAARLGVQGARYEGVCPVEKYPRFEARYRAGRVVFEQRQVVSQQQARVQQWENEWQRLRYEYESTDSRTEDGRYLRTRLRERLREVEYQIRAERDRLYYEEQKLRDLQRQFDQSVA